MITQRLIHLAIQFTDFLWLALAGFWLIAAISTKRTVQRQSAYSRGVQTAIGACSLWLVFSNATRIPVLDIQLTSVGLVDAVGGLLLAMSGLAFALWARVHLGTNWSGVVTLKEGHTLIRSGPYQIVRHPIYTGLLLALAGSALQRGQVRSWVGVAVCGLCFWLKTQVEERLMIQRFGSDYLAYRRHVGGLIPFIVEK